MWLVIAATTGLGMSEAPALLRWMRPASAAGVSALQRRSSDSWTACSDVCMRPYYCRPLTHWQKRGAVNTPEFRAEPFQPAWWLTSPHGQTIAGRVLRRPAPPPFERIRLDTPDGDFLDLDVPPAPASDAPIVLLFHGLEGSARRGYAVNTYRELFHYRVASVGVNFRSCSGEPNRTARFYHSGETGDIRFAIDYVAARFPGRALGAVGFSLGGNALLKCLGEDGDA